MFLLLLLLLYYFSCLWSIKKGERTLQQVEEEHEKLNEITRRSRKSEIQKNTIENVKNLYNSRQKVIDWLNDNSRIRSEAIHEANKK